MRLSRYVNRQITRIVARISPTQGPPICDAAPRAHGRGASSRALLTVLAMIGLCASAGRTHAQGRLVAWGRDDYGQVSGAPAGYNFVAVDAGHNVASIALRADGSVVCWGNDGFGQVSGTPAGNNFVAVSAGGAFSAALRSDGSVVTWGTGIGPAPTGNDFVTVSAGSNHCVALRTDGSLLCWGSSPPAPAGNDFVGAAAGGYFSVALRADGSLIAWGDDSNGEVTGTPGGNDFVAVSAGWNHVVARRSDGSLVSWGRDVEGLVSGTPTGNDFVAASGGLVASTALRADGSLVSWGSNTYFQVTGTPAGNSFTAVSAGSFCSVALAPAVTPEAQIAALSDAVQALVNSGALLPAQGNSLQTKLSAALDLLTRGNTQGAISKLGDIVKQVSSLIKTGKLTSAQGQPLIDAVQALVAQLQGSSSLVPQAVAATGSLPATGSATKSLRLYPGTLDPTLGIITLRFNLPGHTDVTLEFYDLAGRRIDEVRLGSLGPGQHEQSWRPPNHASGLFFCRLKAGEITTTGRLGFVK